MLIVYSNSPYWKKYFERGFLPLVNERVLVLNWSERAQWPVFSSKTIVFKLFKSEKQFNPMLLRFPIFRLPRRIRFYEAFQEAKYGDPYMLIEIEENMSLVTAQTFDLSVFHPRKSA